jgi:putative spermidine/putrescine transport system permease protein
MEKKITVSKVIFTAAVVFYLIQVCGILFSVVMNSLSKGWFSGALPPTWTTDWYVELTKEHNIGQLLFNTFFVAIAVALISLLISFPTAYALARNEFKLKGLILSLLLLPMIIPPIAYGVPLATTFGRLHLTGKLSGVVLANLIPIVPFMILILTPFIEQVGTTLESAAKMLGASKLRIFFKILIPLTLPGILVASILSIVRTISMFELTFLVAGGNTQTIVVALYADAAAAGSRAPQMVDAFAVIYFLISVTCLVIALRFVSPTQMVFKIK